jgi:hypothetical protein
MLCDWLSERDSLCATAAGLKVLLVVLLCGSHVGQYDAVLLGRDVM